VNPDIWKVLDLAPVRDRDAIRRAYARRLKVTSPEDDAEGFRALREAYEHALAALDWDWAWEDEADEDGGADDRVVPVAGIFADAADVLTLLHGGVRTFEAGRSPEPPSALHGDDAHERLLADLENLVAGPDDDASARLETALAAVIASPTMEVLAVAVHTEQRIAHLIAGNAPRSDALVRPAINAFRWSRDRTGLHGGGAIEAVLDRDADIVFRTGVLRGEGPRRPAFLALTRPLSQGPRWRDRCWPGFEPAMRALLAEINERRPSLRADVDPETLSAWEERLGRPHLSPMVLWIAALAPLVPAPLGLMTGPLMALGIYMMGAATCLAVCSLWIFGVAPLRRTWRETWEWRAPIWARAGWAPASLALLLLAGLAPANAWVTAGVGLLAAALALWAVVTSEIDADPAPGAWPLPLKLLFGQSVLVVWWGFLMMVAPEATPTAVTVALAGAVIASAAGASSLPILWYRWTVRPLRFALILALVGAAVWTALQLLDSREATGGAVLAAAATAAVVLAHRPAAGGLGSTALQWRYRVQAFSLLPMVGAGTELGWLKVSGLWLLAGVAVTLIGAIAVEKDL
jgi:hypothetical protein